MKVVIAGSRCFEDYNKLKKILDSIDWSDGDEIVSGTARGADKLGERYAKENSIKLKRFSANWDLYGKSAGYKRNEQMAKYCDKGIVFWDYESKGSKHMIDLLRRYNKEVLIIKVVV